MSRGIFVLVEGFDGVGKTTLSCRIANNLGYEYHKSPEGVFSQARSYFDTTHTNFFDRLSFYSGVALRNSIVAETLVADGVNVIMDRYYYSIIAYHFEEYESLPEKTKKIYRMLLQPDIVFCLELDYLTIKSRQEESGVPMALDDEIFVKQELHEKITTIYRNILPSKTIIDNSGNIDATENEIIEAINNHNMNILPTSFVGG